MLLLFTAKTQILSISKLFSTLEELNPLVYLRVRSEGQTRREINLNAERTQVREHLNLFQQRSITLAYKFSN